MPYDLDEFTGPDALFKFKQMVVTEHSPMLKRGEEYSDEVDPTPCTILEATQGQISSQCPTEATSGRLYLNRS